MKLDARGLKPEELFRKLKHMLSSCGSNESVEVLVYDQVTAKKVKAFASMSGCPVEIEKKEDFFILRITENTCGCAR
jgi:TusA-related sulfurtransferase